MEKAIVSSLGKQVEDGGTNETGGGLPDTMTVPKTTGVDGMDLGDREMSLSAPREEMAGTGTEKDIETGMMVDGSGTTVMRRAADATTRGTLINAVSNGTVEAQDHRHHEDRRLRMERSTRRNRTLPTRVCWRLLPTP